MSEEEKSETKRFFYDKSRIPGVVMYVDGTHIAIKTPSHNKHLYYNRKGFHSTSINTILICDNKQWIRCVDATNPGSNHDSFIWNSSEVSAYFCDTYCRGDRNTRILGDSGYDNLPWLLTPFRSVDTNSPETRLNQQHSRGRNIVERTIGVLKSRFRCLMGVRVMHYEPEKAAQIINVCCAVHNICMHFKIFWDEQNEVENSDEFQVENEHDEYIPSSQLQFVSRAAEIKLEIMNSL